MARVLSQKPGAILIFKAALLEDATPVVADLGYYGRQGEHMVVVENTPEQHNMVVCTLVQLLPVAAAGYSSGMVQIRRLPRARRTREPRKVLAEFGVTLPKNILGSCLGFDG